jgi:hypothetical protein
MIVPILQNKLYSNESVGCTSTGDQPVKRRRFRAKLHKLSSKHFTSCKNPYFRKNDKLLALNKLASCKNGDLVWQSTMCRVIKGGKFRQKYMYVCEMKLRSRILNFFVSIVIKSKRIPLKKRNGKDSLGRQIEKNYKT